MGKRKFHWTFNYLLLCVCLLVTACPALADVFSYQGSLGSSTDTFQLNFTLSVPFNVTIQTYGFGGGVNGAGTTIAPGGFDPLIALFDGTGTIIDGTSDTLLNYYTTPFFGCPPAGMVTIGTGVGADVCGDIFMSFNLGPGSYSLVLADANYQPNALIMPGASTLADGFTDFTGGSFDTCNLTSNGTTCVTRTADWAFDIALPVPEPASWSMLAGAVVLVFWRRRRVR